MFEYSGCVFFMYRADRFIELAGKHAGVDVGAATLREVRELGKQDETQTPTSITQTAPGVNPDEVLGLHGRPMNVRTAGTFLRHTELEVLVADDSPTVEPLEVTDDSTKLSNTPKADPDAE